MASSTSASEKCDWARSWASRVTVGCSEYQQRAPSRYRCMAWSDSFRRASPKVAGASPGWTHPSLMARSSSPLLAASCDLS